MSKSIFLAPDGRQQPISDGTTYRAAHYIFESNRHFFAQKAQASVDSGTILGYEQFLLMSGYCLFLAGKPSILASNLTAAQIIYLRANIHDFDAAQREALISAGVVTQEDAENHTADYYENILTDIASKYEQQILDTYGNSHDFNRDRCNIRYNINKLRSANPNTMGEDEYKKAVRDHIMSIRYQLVKFQVFAEDEILPIRMHERYIKLDLQKQAGKSYKYIDEKRMNIARILGLEVQDEVRAAGN